MNDAVENVIEVGSIRVKDLIAAFEGLRTLDSETRLFKLTENGSVPVTEFAAETMVVQNPETHELETVFVLKIS